MPLDPDQPVDYGSLTWPALPVLNTDTIWAILNKEIPDMVINQLLWQALGYRFDTATQTWNTLLVAPDWIADYPQPPDFIAGRPASVKLTRSIAAENKQLLKEKLGFKGYKIGDFGPAETRRATAANWLLSYDMVGVKDSMVDQVKVLIEQPSTENIKDALRLLSLERAQVLQAEFIAEYGLKVQAGLFEGMEYLPDCAEGCYIPKLLGCYEAELEPYFRQAIAKPYQAIINIGCSEGFYAVGLAKLMPQVQVYAHDTNEAAWADCQQLASQNGVIDRIHIGGTFAPPDFQKFSDRQTLVLCDIEGGEESLLDPSLAPALSKMDIIVELHDGFAPNIQETLIQRFEKTHEISIVPHILRSITLPPLLQNWGSLDQLLALCEWRAFPTPWLVMWAKQ